jgi:L-rhamnose mutarotase
MTGRNLFAYMEVQDFEAYKRRIAANSNAQSWKTQMAPIMERAIQPEAGFREVLPTRFHID